ncbi:hypothetical protein AFL01nite_12450 [Aeromicrobium flavum]|uniref:Uncharacterized protein n=1 Tax=Aeromicrobium flavum TaxID=416568 RepID=A0A512HU00_9ACTN|nr:hypothetical protein [Aeromicrobium flavum]GEO88918.1 hypothetical protein AFL01nite_12450 [Aeromicrobium flavum]
MSRTDRVSARWAGVLLACALALGLAVGGGVIAVTQAVPPGSTSTDAPPRETQRPGPELIPARTDDGKQGFIRVDEMNRANPRELGTPEVVLNVYAEDGRTKIGVYTAAVTTVE